MTQVTPYGSWKSPITSDLIVKGTIGLGQLKMNGSDLYWIEMRPSEGGRQVIVRHPRHGKSLDITPTDFNARTRVHEYGGGDFVTHDGQVYFTNFADQRIYRQVPGFGPLPLTQTTDVPGALRYADAALDSKRNRLVCVREDHRESNAEATNILVGINLSDGGATTLVSGNDSYSSPRVSPDGSRLAWLTWNHPNMPWDGCELWAAEIGGDGSILAPELIAGGARESIFQPEWSPDGILHFVSDRTGWWNLYRSVGGLIENLCEMEAEFGVPQWIFGLSTYAFESTNSIVCAFAERGIWKLGILNTKSCALEQVDLPFTEISYVCAAPGRAIFRAGSPTEPFAIVEMDLTTQSTIVLRHATNVSIDQGYISEPAAIEFPTESGLTAHGFFYPPKNRDFEGPAGERAPLLVKSHGGPTSATVAVFMLGIQYWTSRGIAVLDVNYGGSTGYGRAYRERLNGNWGVVDVDDCVSGARFLASRGSVDGERLMIDGGSAGGYTTLCALTFRDAFKAGASHFGVSDIEALDEDTHKFESRYSTTLIGPYPERRDLYIERSPIHFADRLACPVIFFQGLEDKVVPPNQAEKMVEALRKKGVPVAYVAFEGEQHGFRKAENIKRALDGELYFYSRVFGFQLVDEIEPVTIENL
jgi:dipeptidyl aminopeptidase/acylaminoacyl peptidase